LIVTIIYQQILNFNAGAFSFFFFESYFEIIY
jgi:hypothetical protein